MGQLLDIADIEPDGSLTDIGSIYVNWRRGDAAATLDGAFSSVELRAIADHMDSVSALPVYATKPVE